FWMQLIVTSCKKMKVYHVDDSQNWDTIIDKYREALLNEDYILSNDIQELLGRGAVMSFRSGIVARRTSFKEDVINFIEVPETDEYVINGGKVFTTNSGFADYCTVFAFTDKTQGTRGMSCFVVDLHQEGVTVSQNIKRMGIRAAQNCEVTYENVRVPAFNRIGKEGQGFKIAMKALDGGRIGIAAQSVGLAQGAINEAMAYVKERKQFGRPLSAFQTTQFKLADMQTKVDAARLLTWRAALCKDNGESYSKEAAMAKLFASDVANQVCREAVQLMGGYGYCREYPVERALRDAKITEIYEGTSEVMKMVISGAMKVNAK
ncbi:MAG: acyl-CoA dehydrogenase family protein, partial [Parasporobacterium sp.]|nr:acyl-CoA dehydrogenase family protein [Parasporobacterium sp.]